jgi:hypothetical protein
MNSHQNAHQQVALQTVTVPDLNVTIEATRLICSVYHAIQQVTWRRGTPAPDADPTPDPILQSLLTYSYAVGNVCSDDIEAAAIHDPAARYLCANHTPRSETIREFRRANSASVTASLANLFRTIAATIPETYSTYSFERLRRFSPNQNFHSLAQQRLARAIQADSHALDI